MTGRYKVGLTGFITFYTAIVELAGHFAGDNVADMCDGARRRAARHFGLHLGEPVESYLCLHLHGFGPIGEDNSRGFQAVQFHWRSFAVIDDHLDECVLRSVGSKELFL